MTVGTPEPEAGPVQVRGTVLTVRRVDAYYAMTVVAPGIAARFKPGQFVTLAVGGPATSMLLRRAFSIHDVRPITAARWSSCSPPMARGPGGWPSAAPGTSSTSPGRSAGRSRCPGTRSSCLLVGGGYGSAPLFSLAARLRERRCTVDFLLGASTGDRVFGALTARRTGRTATITTEDGSLGRARDRHRHDGPDHPRGKDRRHLRLRPDADAAPGDAAGPAATTSRCKWRWRN